MNRTLAFFMLALFLALAFPRFAFAQNDLVSNTGVIDVTYICDTVNGDDGCYLEGFAVLYGDTSSLNLHGLSQTSVSADSFDDGWDGYVVGDVLQDGKEIAGPSQAGDNGQGVSVIIWNVAINLNATHVFDVRTDSYYNYMGNAGCAGGGTCAYIASAQQMVTLGRPAITSVSPPYVFVGTTGTLTLNGSNFVNPFGNPTSIGASKTSGTGFSVSTGTVGSTQASAPYTAALTATTGNWDIGLTYSLGSSILISTFGSFTVGDPTPTISSISPSSWAAGQVNIPVTIQGSGYGSNPQLVIAGVTSSITGHSDNGQPGGAVITANVSVPGCATGTAGVTVTSTGYNGTGFGNAYPGQLSYVLSTATITPAAALAPNITFNGSVVSNKTTTVVVGQQILVSGMVPSQACTSATNWSWQQQGTAVGGYNASNASGQAVAVTPSTGPSFMFYWPYSGTNTVTASYTLVNGQVSPAATATFKIKGVTSGPMTSTAGTLNVNKLTGCTGHPGGYWLNFGNLSGPIKACGQGTANPPGMAFSSTGYSQPGSGSFSFVQTVNSDSVVLTKAAGGTTTCTGTGGLDGSYPYPSQPPNSATTNDSPGNALYDSAGTSYVMSTRGFTATMYPLWKSSTANSIPAPLGGQNWKVNDAVTFSNGKWQKPTGSGGTSGNFFQPNPAPPSYGYPTWTNLDATTCH